MFNIYIISYLSSPILSSIDYQETSVTVLLSPDTNKFLVAKVDGHVYLVYCFHSVLFDIIDLYLLPRKQLFFPCSETFSLLPIC